MRILVAGASGLLGAAVVKGLELANYDVWRLVRPQTKSKGFDTKQILWDPQNQKLHGLVLEGFDAVIHLGGDGVSGRRWSKSKKEHIRDSRINSTKLLADALAELRAKPEVFITASALGYYGDRGSAWLDENASPGQGFLSEVCEAWEAATLSAEQAGIRTAHLRIGVVLSTKGGALKRMLWPFRLGLGGIFGTGKQFVSWVSVQDVVAMVRFIIEHKPISGPVNIVSPNPVSNRDFTKALAQVLGRRAWMIIPERLIKLLLGQMGEELFLFSARLRPHKLIECGYKFLYPDLVLALRHQLHR